jgi:DNA-binding response OmpR family regulator
MLENKTILIVEGEVLIALDIQRNLAGENARDIIFARSAGEVSRIARPLPVVDLAIIELVPGDSDGPDLVRALVAQGVPCAMTSTDLQANLLLVDLEHIPVLQKPFSQAQLLATVRAILTMTGRPQLE